MKTILATLALTIVLIACKEKNTVPPAAPVSINDVKKSLPGNTFTTTRIGTVSPFAKTIEKETPYRWMDDEKNVDDFTKKFVAERMKFNLQFVDDSLVKITDDGKIWDATYKIDNEAAQDEKSGIRLRFTYEDTSSQMNLPNGGTPMLLTSTYYVAGIGDKNLLLETPRQLNRQTVALWMKAK